MGNLLNDLQTLLLNGFWVSVICTTLFLIVKLPGNWKPAIKELAMKLIVAAVAFFWAWLVVSNPEWTEKQLIMEWVKLIAFSIAFYEFAGKYLVRKFFKGYRTKKEEELLKQ